MDSDSEWLRRALLERGHFEAAAVLASDIELQRAEEEEEEEEEDEDDVIDLAAARGSWPGSSSNLEPPGGRSITERLGCVHPPTTWRKDAVRNPSVYTGRRA